MSQSNTPTMNIKKITATIDPTDFSKYIMKAIRICPFDSTTIHTTFSTRMTYDIHTEDDVITISVPNVRFQLNYDRNSPDFIPLLERKDMEITPGMSLNDAMNSDSEESYDIELNGYSLFDSVFYKDEKEDEYHMDPHYAVIVEKARMLHANMDNILKFARAKTEFGDRWYVDYSYIFKVFRFAIQVCGLE
jgi:hypothetical protein